MRRMRLVAALFVVGLTAAGLSWASPESTSIATVQRLGQGSPAATVAPPSLFQHHRDGSIWEYVGPPIRGWLELDHNPATIAVVSDGLGKVYQLHADGTIWQYTGTPIVGWVLLDNNPATVKIAADGGYLWQLHRDGSIWQYLGLPGWELLDNNPATMAIVPDWPDLYQLHRDGSIWRYSVYGPPLHGWQLLDNNPGTLQIAAFDFYLIQRHRDGSIWLYIPHQGLLGSDWVMTDNNPATVDIVVGRAPPPLLTTDEPLLLYQLHRDGSIWQGGLPVFLKCCGGWMRLDNNPATVAMAANRGNLYQLHRDGSIWHYLGTPGWELLDNNPATDMVTAWPANPNIQP